MYDVHTEGAQKDACGWEEGSVPCGLHKIKLQPTDVILYSCHTRKLAGFFTRTLSVDGIKI